MTALTADNPTFIEESGFTGMIVDDSGTIAAREYHNDHVTADGVKQRVLVSTVTEEAYRGQGLAGKIVQYTLDKALDDGYRIVAICPYVQSWLQKHNDARYEQARDPARPEHFPKEAKHD